MNHQILVLDDDIELTKNLNKYLTLEGYTSTISHDGPAGLKLALSRTFDAVILEIALPQMNGFKVIQRIREFKDTPILILTARTEEIDRLVGFEIGADDYLQKPCDPYELLARLHALLKRTKSILPHKAMIQHGPIQVDCQHRTMTIQGEAIELTNTEFCILEILIKSPGEAFSKEELTEYALGRKYTAYDRSIDVHISHLRNKLGDKSIDKPWIKTVRGFGYYLET